MTDTIPSTSPESASPLAIDAFRIRVTDAALKIKTAFGSSYVFNGQTEEGDRWSHILLDEDSLDALVALEEHEGEVRIDVRCELAQAWAQTVAL